MSRAEELIDEMLITEGLKVPGEPDQRYSAIDEIIAKYVKKGVIKPGDGLRMTTQLNQDWKPHEIEAEYKDKNEKWPKDFLVKVTKAYNTDAKNGRKFDVINHPDASILR